MNVEKVSIIVPAFNAAATIKQCLDSLLRQNYKNFEVIIVNDGSTDGTSSVLAEYKKVPSVIVLDTENHGVSYARNLGLRFATGNWVVFVDADDYVNEQFIETMLTIAISKKADVVCCNYYSLKNQKLEKDYFLNFNKVKIFQGKNIANIINSCISNRIYGNKRSITNIGVPWGKLYRKTLISDIKFPENLSNMEDMLFNICVFSNVARVVYIPDNLYCYRVYSQSTSNRPNDEYERIASCIIRMLCNYVMRYEYNELCVKAVDYKRFCLFFECMQKDTRVYNEGNEYIKSRLESLLNNKLFDPQFKIKLLKAYTFPQLVYSVLIRANALKLLSYLLSIVYKSKRLIGD